MNYPLLWVMLRYDIILVTTVSSWQRKAEVANKYLGI